MPLYSHQDNPLCPYTHTKTTPCAPILTPRQPLYPYTHTKTTPCAPILTPRQPLVPLYSHQDNPCTPILTPGWNRICMHIGLIAPQQKNCAWIPGLQGQEIEQNSPQLSYIGYDICPLPGMIISLPPLGGGGSSTTFRPDLLWCISLAAVFAAAVVTTAVFVKLCRSDY